MNTFLGFFAFIVLCGLVFAQNPTPEDIQRDFDQTFDQYFTAATKFVDKLVDELDIRVDQFVAAHFRLFQQLGSILLINGTNLDENYSKIINDGMGSIEGLMSDYRTALDHNIIINELNRHLNVLRANITNAQELIDVLKGWVAQNPEVGRCWNSTKDEIGNLVNNGFIQASDAAIFAITNANSTLNLIEFLVLSTVDSNNFLISSCQNDINFLNSCIVSFLTTTQVTLPANINFWLATISSTVSTNLIIADSLVQSAAAFALANIPFITASVEACVRGVVG